MNRKLIAAIVLILAAWLAVHFYAEWKKARFEASIPKPLYAEWEKARFEASIPKPPAPAPAPRANLHGGHDHGEEEVELEITLVGGVPGAPKTMIIGSDEHRYWKRKERQILFKAQSVTNPLLTRNVYTLPARLILPEKWVGIYDWELDAEPEAAAELKTTLSAIYKELLTTWNPKRPIGEIWDDFIAGERKAYLEAVEHPTRDPARSIYLGGSRVDLVYLNYVNYPEIILLLADEKESDRMFDMWHVERGAENPDWNLALLPDGREFRVKTGYEYLFRYTDETGEAVTTSLGAPGTGEEFHQLTIDLDRTSNEELEALGGWNYNFSRYTGLPTR